MNQSEAKVHIQDLLIKHVYSGPILNNSHRGDFVEMMALAALGPEWRFVSGGWHPWDLQRGSGSERVRIQVKQSAALQLWGETKKMMFSFPWSDKPPAYFFRDNPNEKIEDCGWFCDLFVVGIHDVKDLSLCDQTNADQWKFFVIPISELPPKSSSMTIDKTLKRWTPVSWKDLKTEVNAKILNGSLDLKAGAS